MCCRLSRTLLLLLICATLAVPAAARAETASQAFATLQDDSWEWALRQFPQFATRAGDHRYDDQLGEVSLARIQVISELAVGKAHDSVRMGKAPSPEGGSSRAALGRGAECVLESDRVLGESVSVVRPDVRYSVATQALTQVVADDS